MLGGSADGTARQYAVFDAEGLVINPPELGDLEAATLPCAGLTAWNALYQHRPIQPGEWVYCPGTGGVSLAALQFAKAAGAQGRDHFVFRCQAGAGQGIGSGCLHQLPHRARSRRGDPRGGGRRRRCGGRCGRKDQLDLNLSLLNPGGLVAAIGMLAAHFSWGADQFDDPRLGRISVGNREEHEAMLAFIAKHAVRPVVDVVYDLTRLQDAYRRLESGKFFGKVGVSLL